MRIQALWFNAAISLFGIMSSGFIMDLLFAKFLECAAERDLASSIGISFFTAKIGMGYAV